MRLIDVDKLIDKLIDESIYEWVDGNGKIDISYVRALIYKQPTAYDVEKVVEKLENKKFKAFMTLANTGDKQLDMIYENVGNCIDNAIEIVKAGGIDED